MQPPKVIVVGAGIIGSTIAYQLASAGASVTVVDAELPGRGATQHSFGWIGRSPRDGNPAERLRSLGRDYWERLEREVTGLEMHWTGALVWGECFAHDGTPSIDKVAEVEPHLLIPAVSAEHRADDGWIDPVRASESLILAAQEHGATTQFGTPVTRLIRAEDGAIGGIELGSETLLASTVVIAAGVGSSALCATVGVDVSMVSSPAVMVKLRASQGIVRGIVANDGFEARQSDDGTVLMPFDYNGETTAGDLERTGENALGLFKAAFCGATSATLESVDVGWRPMLSAGESLFGSPVTSGLYVAVAHPGVMLAPVIGDAITKDILVNATENSPKNYRDLGFLSKSPQRP